MSRLNRCVVGGCESTSKTHQLFMLPHQDDLRNLWLDFLVPTNPGLAELSKDQLIRKRVCGIHFDRYQFGPDGQRIRLSYPCLFSEKEIDLGIPLATAEWSVWKEHNYHKEGGGKETAQPPLPEDEGADDPGFDEHPIYYDETVSSSRDEPEFDEDPIYNDEIIPSSKDEPEFDEDPIYSDETAPKVANRRKLVSKNRKFINHMIAIAAHSSGDHNSQRLRRAQDLSGDARLFADFISLNEQAKDFLLIQLRLVGRNKMARPFTLDENLIALSLLKQSPEGYVLLEKMFGLPSRKSLLSLSGKICFERGLSPKIFEYIGKATKNWDIKKKLCTIVFGQVALTPNQRQERKGMNKKNVEEGGETEFKSHDHALVFMTRGICYSWRQCVAYYFCKGTVPAAELTNVLEQIVSQVVQTGLVPLGLVCDHGLTFRTAIRRLREEAISLRNIHELPDDGTVHIAGRDLSVFFDPPHLLKAFRNHFLTKDILWGDKIATWRDIQYIYEVDITLGCSRTMPMLTAHHVDPVKMKRMKVLVAAQALSARTAAMLKYTDAIYKTQSRESTMATTGDVVEFFDKLFDSVNGCPGGSSGGKLRDAIKPHSSQHFDFWRTAIEETKQLKFIDKRAMETGRSRLIRVPSLDSWATTLESFLRISRILFRRYDVECFYPRYVNQDPLENLFERIRGGNCRNVY